MAPHRISGSAASKMANALIELWQSRRQDNGLPARDDFDVLELRPWIGNLELVEIEPGPPRRYRYRLVGTNITDLDGMDITGRYADEVFTPDMSVTGEYDAAVDERKPVQTQLERRNAKGYDGLYHKLTLPLADENGAVVMLMVLIVEVERE